MTVFITGTDNEIRVYFFLFEEVQQLDNMHCIYVAQQSSETSESQRPEDQVALTFLQTFHMKSEQVTVLS